MKSLLSALCVSLFISLQAQEFKLNYSEPGEVKKDVSQFHKYGNYLYSNETDWGKMQFAYTATLKKVKYGVEITRYDENLNVVKKLSLDNGEKNFGPFEPMVHYGKSAIYVMYFRFVDDDNLKMFVAKVNPEDLSVVSTKEIMEYGQKNNGFLGMIKTIGDSKTLYTVSNDGNKAWIVHASPTLMLTCVIDGDLNVIQKAESISIKMEKLEITGAYISNDGNKVMAYRYDDPAVKEFYSRGLFFQPANAKGAFKPIKFRGGNNPGNLGLAPSNDGQKLYIGGEYFEGDYGYGGKGVLLGEVDVAGQLLSEPNFYPYTDELKQRVLDLDFANKKKGEIIFKDKPYFRIAEMENGTVVLSADMLTSASSSDGRTTFYYKGPIIHAFITPDGKANMTLIAKRQASGSATNFFNYVYKDKLICVYGNLPKFVEKEYDDSKIGMVRTLGDIVPVVHVYDATGKLLSKKMLINNTKELKGTVMLADRTLIDKNKFLFPVGETKVNMVKYYTRVNQMCYLEIL